MIVWSVNKGVVSRIFPLGSIKPEIPVLAALAMALRFSTALNTAMEKCCMGAEVCPNQASLVMVVRISAPFITKLDAIDGNKISKQMSTPVLRVTFRLRVGFWL